MSTFRSSIFRSFRLESGRTDAGEMRGSAVALRRRVDPRITAIFRCVLFLVIAASLLTPSHSAVVDGSYRSSRSPRWFSRCSFCSTDPFPRRDSRRSIRRRKDSADQNQLLVRLGHTERKEEAIRGGGIHFSRNSRTRRQRRSLRSHQRTATQKERLP